MEQLTDGRISSSLDGQAPYVKHIAGGSSVYEVINHSAKPIETVIHIYVKDKTASIVQPVRRLIASQVVSIHADEKKSINYTLSKEALMFYNNQGEKIWESGEFTFSLSTVDSEDDRTIQL